LLRCRSVAIGFCSPARTRTRTNGTKSHGAANYTTGDQTRENRTFSLVAEWAQNTMPYAMPSVRRDLSWVSGFVAVRLRAVVEAGARKLAGKPGAGARRLEA
jgi:hypothetical protein